MTTITRNITTITALAALAAIASCVDHRPLRTEVFNENVYLPKDYLTRENPHKKGQSDHAWLYKMTVTKVSTPEVGFMPSGEYSQPRYVRFQFAQNKVQMVDDNEYAPMVEDKDGKKIPPHVVTPAILNAWPGTHVDIKYKDNMDGERTNVLEENREAPWKQRQYFKVDFEEAEVPDVNMFYWWNTDINLGQCVKLRSVSLVPDTFELEKDAEKGGDDYFSWTVAVTYEWAVNAQGGYCYSTITDAMDRTTFTFHVKYAFWRVPKSDYKAVEHKEKDPIRKQVGAWETGLAVGGLRLGVYYDPKTDLPGAKSYLVRFDPAKKHTFYFSPSWPERYKQHFKTTVKKQVDGIMQQAGAKMRIDFKDHDWECHDNDESTKCKPRKVGDPRYSMLHYHDAPMGGPIGMAEMVFDPRTGETLSATLNMYDWPDRLYANLLKDYIKGITKDTFDKNSPLKEPCKPGDTVKIDDTLLKSKYKSTSLYTKLVSYMNEEPGKWVPERSDDFRKYMAMLLPEIRFAHPGWNNYVSTSAGSMAARYHKMAQKEAQFRQLMNRVEGGESPFSGHVAHSPEGIKAGLATIKATKEGIRNHIQLRAYEKMLHGLHNVCGMHDGWQLGPAMVRAARVCKKNGKWETVDEWTQRVVDTYFKVFATHEFGHNLGLRHNFYGTVDKKHMNEGEFTSSIMDYPYTHAEAGSVPKFQPYDVMALKWIYGGDKYKPDPKENWLYCTDEHSAFSPFCTTWDVGTTPSEIIKNAIDSYEWNYKFRNFRAYRKFWSTWSYYARVFNDLYPMRRFLNLWGVDWYSSGIKNDLMLLGVKGDENFFTNITNEFNDELGRTMRMVVNFYKAILQQSAAERSYATKFDNFFGDVTQQGIIDDKYYAMFLFLGLWPIDDYDQNIYGYIAMHEYSLGNSMFYADAQDVADSMIGGQYDVYPWFKPLAVLLFAQDTANVNFSDKGKQKWIEMRKFERLQDMIDFFGFDPRTEALKKGNDYQTFKDSKGEEWIYYYMVDRNLHLAAAKFRNPTAYKILWDQNESINVNKSGSLTDYTIKYYLDYYDHFN